MKFLNIPVFLTTLTFSFLFFVTPYNIYAQSCKALGASCIQSEECCPPYECDTNNGQGNGLCKNLETQGECEQNKCNTDNQCVVYHYNPDPARGGCYRTDKCNSNTDCIPTPTIPIGSCQIQAPNTVQKGKQYEVKMKKTQLAGPLNCTQPTIGPSEICVEKITFTNCATNASCKGIIKAKKKGNCTISFECINTQTLKKTSCDASISQTH